MRHLREYQTSYRRATGSSHFSISDADFERDSVLKRRRYGAPSNEAQPKKTSRTRARSKSISRDTVIRRLPSVQSIPLVALGRRNIGCAPITRNRSPSVPRQRTATRIVSSSPSRSRGQSPSRTSSSSRAQNHRESRPTKRSPSISRHHRPRSSSSSSSSSAPSISSQRKNSSVRKRNDNESDRKKTNRKEPSDVGTVRSTGRSPITVTTPTSDITLKQEIQQTTQDLSLAKKELDDLEGELALLQQRVDAKKYIVMDLNIVMDGLLKRQVLQQQYMRQETPTKDGEENTSISHRPSKRPCIVEGDEEDDDDEVMIIDPPPVKQENIIRPSSATLEQKRSVQRENRASKSSHQEPSMTDHFWGRVDVAKLLVQPRIQLIPDTFARKGRHLVFNPVEQDVFATSSDDGGIAIWNYLSSSKQIKKLASFSPISFRKENQCAESIAWSPNGQRLAVAFRDPIGTMSEFCIATLHQLSLSPDGEQIVIPRDRVRNKPTTLHARGISAIEWLPNGYDNSTDSKTLITAGSDHNVVLWEEGESHRTDFLWTTLHREHRSDVRTICVHSQRNVVYTGGLDGMVIRYDLNSFKTQTLIERRRPHISKINAILENPHNPHLLMISSVEPDQHNLLLHDLRERYNSSSATQMTLSLMRSNDTKSMSQYIVPRWSPGGFHVSCGSTNGIVNIWDVRVRGSAFPIVHPQQSIRVHQKQVLHATWHPRHDALFSMSHDRTIGLLTFR